MFVALLAEASLGAGAALAQGRINIAAQQRGDVYFHLLPAQVGILHRVAVDGAGLIFWEHNGRLGADPRARGTIGLAVVVVLRLDSMLLVHPVNSKQTKAQTLHAIRAAVVVNDRKPRLPVAVYNRSRPGADTLGCLGNAGGVEASDVLKTDRRFRRNVFRLACASLGELAEHEQRPSRMRRHASARNGARDRETFFPQRRQSIETLDAF